MIIRVIIVLLVLSHFNLAFAQTTTKERGSIRVKVVDADNNQPVPFAIVYFSKTTIGGYTDASGVVEVKNIPFGSYEMISSEVSHKPSQRKLVIKSTQTLHLTVQLLVRTLQEVQVTAKRDDKWNRQYVRFQKLFFGNDHYKDCKIINPAQIDFKTVQGQFVAESHEPLKIENNYLGYNLEFDLRTCAFASSTFLITGNVRFEEQKGNDSLKGVWKKHREEAYRGSPPHFLRSMIDSSMQTVGYEMYNDITSDANIVRLPNFISNLQKNITTTNASDRVTQLDNGNYAIAFPYRLEVHYMRRRAPNDVYRNVSHPISWLEVKGGQKLIITHDGIVQNPEALTVLGNMASLRIGEWLPTDYQYVDVRQSAPAVVDNPIVVDDALLEKSYIQTDRNYYYKGETMWLKGYMSYSIPMLRDTMSQSIYVELADAGGNVVLTKRYKVEDGAFNGDIVFNNNLKPGLYQLRAYTAWMLNFDRDLIFAKTIDVLDDRQAVKAIADYKPSTDTLPNISIRTDKTSYSAREKIMVTIDVIDSLDFRTAADLSIAVTDIVQAVPLKNEKTILSKYSFNKRESIDTSQHVKYNIEYGIDFSGQFMIKNKPQQASITVFQENSKETMGIITDDQGKFWRSLAFNDTLSFYLNALSAYNKKGIVVMNQSPVRSPKLDIEPLELDLYTSDDVLHVQSSFNGAKVLKEVTVKATKIEKPQPAVIHGKGDYTVTGDWITQHNYNDVFFAIASKVPGVNYSGDGTGTALGGGGISFRTSQFGSLGDAPPPLMLVDNIQVTDPSQIRDIPIRSIERVDIIKFGGASIYGARGAGGVIAIYTKNGASPEEGKAGFDKSKLQEVKMLGYSTSSKFTAPEYSDTSTEDRFDGRATIYWSPFVSTDDEQPATISFYAADIATKYRIVIEGVTKGGIPVYAEKVIEVVKGH